MNNNKKIVVFSDLDGSLLNAHYEFSDIESSLQEIYALKASIVLVSSKTKSEISLYREKLQLADPYIAENGSAIIIPKNYFTHSFDFSKTTDGNQVIELGLPHGVIRRKLAAIKQQTRASIVGFADMTVEEVAADNGLPLAEAKLAKEREYSEPFKILSENKQEVLQALSEEGLCYTLGGRYFHALGDTDKGKAVAILIELYRQQFGDVCTVGVGDGPNDLSMLEKLDKPFYIDGVTKRVTVWKEIVSAVQTLACK
ncbi:MAG: HAD-IIB family hydrolase [Candidatus Bathyarchaeia archaeon]